ncbi:hypothetical protein [Bacillus sp. FJAT-45350]|uniref:hypothetical protein n=1 Tax=Bacillus sp. FJAT-45350 TaxID=2011014 RepID=UPI000BB7C293|nr:hypothetical protein [Bacillus sp. FJAT-45350]
MDNIIRVAIPVVIALISLILFKPNVLTFITSTRSERLLLNKELRQLYYFLAFISVFIIMPVIFVYTQHFNQSGIYEFALNNTQFLAVSIIVGFLSSLGLYLSLDFFLENKKIVLFKVIFLIVHIIYLSILCFLFAGALIEVFHYTELTEAITDGVFLLLFYFASLLPLFALCKRLFHQDIHVIIKLSNGQIIKNAYLLHPTYGNRIVIGEYPIPDMCEHLMVIPNKKIVHIQFFISTEIRPKSLVKKEKSPIIITKSKHSTRKRIIKNNK